MNLVSPEETCCLGEFIFLTHLKSVVFSPGFTVLIAVNLKRIWPYSHFTTIFLLML